MGGHEGEFLGDGAAVRVCMMVWLANSETGVGAAAVPLTSFNVPGTAPNNLQRKATSQGSPEGTALYHSINDQNIF